MTVVLVGDSPSFTPAQRAAIRRTMPTAEFFFLPDADEIARHIGEAEVFAGTLSPALFRRAARLRWVHSWRAGPDELMYDELLGSDVLITSSSGNGAIPLAEHALMFMLMLNRDMPQWMDDQRRRVWHRRQHGELTGLTCGIIGLGAVGRALARMLRPHRMRVLGLRRRPGPVAGIDEVYGSERRHDFLAACDFVVVTAPLTPATTGMLGTAELRAMKATAFLVVVSRGGIVVDDALLTALHGGWIAGAALGAHSVEPLPADSPFWTAPNVLVTPHNGATTALVVDRSVRIFCRNLRRYKAGRPLVNLVDKRERY